ncbi:MAG TPA: hypothetical protein VF911_11510 [Thermoanaerobaculia bacterium]
MRPFVRPGLFRRLFNLPAPENGYVALENLLATRAWSDIHEGDVAAALQAHGVRSLARVRAKELYARALASFAADDVVTDAEADGLQRLRNLLGIRDVDAEEVEREVVHPRYERRVAEVLSDDYLSEAEKARLTILRKGLRVDERKALAIFERRAEALLTRRWQEAVDDRRLSDDERGALDAMARNFGIRVDVDAATKAQLDRFQWFWLAERGTFPQIAAPINLQRDEVCHFSSHADLHEMRTETQRTYSSGTSVRIKIMKGVYYRVGSTQTHRVTRDVLRHIDSGTLYITNKRVIFDGSKKNNAIRLANVLSVIPYSDGIELEKTSGRNPIFTVGDAEWLTILLTSRLAHA